MNSLTEQLVHAIELQNRGQTVEAVDSFQQILSVDPNNAAALYSLAIITLGKGDNAVALSYCDLGLKSAPQFAPLHYARGAVLQSMGLRDEALKSYDEALKFDPNNVSVLLNSGVLLRDLFRHREALLRFNQILTIDNNHAGALANCAILLSEFKQTELAITRFERLLQIEPDFDYGLGLLSYERLHLCDWTDFQKLSDQIIEGIRAGRRSCKTLAFMAISDSAEDHLRAARIFSEYYCPPAAKPLWQGERYRHDKIRVAYISPDLREHPVGHLVAGIFEHHDKSRFETIAISLGMDDGSRIRARMLKSFDRFIDAQLMTSAEIAALIREMEVDIAVDLAGYTSDSRTAVFALRPAPVQVNYLGYPGTMGAEYMDYILADRNVIPPEHQQFYTEKVAYLPDTYLPTDGGIKISDRTPSRAECGLPETGIVFCSFSHDYKISPPLFDIWMRLLQKVAGSVLWLMSRSEISQHNLRREAEVRGIDPSRLVFAGRVPLVEDHLARYRQADIFLDTHPYNAHTTAADALMAGLPVVTYMGNAFPARVAGSLLSAIGLPELIAHSREEYEQLAYDLAMDPNRCADLKARLLANRSNYPLFNTERFCRHLEAAYTSMRSRSEDNVDNDTSRERSVTMKNKTPTSGLVEKPKKSKAKATGVPAAMVELHEEHWCGFLNDTRNRSLYDSWWNIDRVNFWRHTRLMSPVLEVLSGLKSHSWLTIGDGSGTDAWMMLRVGFTSVLATDLDDTVLTETRRRGYITDFQIENGESLSFADGSFDFVLCKESLHHMNRPYAAIYEIMRVARYGVVVIEPQDPWVDWPCRTDPTWPHYEAVGNYVYQFSARELEKIAYGMNITGVATRSLVDVYIPDCEFALRTDDSPIWIETKKKVDEGERAVAQGTAKPNYILGILFKNSVDKGVIEMLAKQHPGWTFKSTDTNPHIKPGKA